MEKSQPIRVACYCRSSKDRSDVSIDAQRRELQKLAEARGYLIVHEYTDVVESGKDTYRAGFQAMLRDLKAPRRAWDALLMVDTSRLSRRRYAAQAFKHEAKKRGIDIFYSKVPEVDPITNVLIESVLEAFDEVHSLMSREKGLGGMAENVQKGFRAGGRAPRGYQLKHVATGKMREGEEVLKSVLEPSPEAALVGRYLNARANNRSRRALKRELGIAWPDTTLIGMEWNALTYAGHTVWNVRNGFDRGEGYQNGHKRRPREEWHVKRDTHPPLISDEEAEQILAQFARSAHTQRRRTDAAYILTGLLQAPDGTAWHGNGGARYRNKTHARNVDREAIEDAIVGRLLEDMHSANFVEELTREARRYAKLHAHDPAAELRPQLKDVTARISRTMDLLARMADPDPALRKVDELEQRRKALTEEIARLDREHRAAQALHDLTHERVARLLADTVHEMQHMHRENMKDLLSNLIERIVLNPTTLDCQIHYKIGIRNTVASPRDSGVIPILRIISTLKVA